MITPDIPVKNLQPATDPITITIPDGNTMRSSHTRSLNIPDLPPEATHAHIVPELDAHSLISLGQLCDAGCTATIDKNTLDVSYNDKIVMTGHRNDTTNLWQLDYPETIQKENIFPHYAHAAAGTSTTEKLVSFMHAALFSPTIDTLYKALTKGYITNMPGLTATTLRKHPPASIPMIKGHLDQKRKNIQSTKNNDNDIAEETEDDLFPLLLEPNNTDTMNYCYSTIFQPTGTAYTDQTGYMVQTSNRGNNLLVIMYDYDSNAILAEPIRSRNTF